MIDGLKPYDKLRNAAQRWLGKVPAHWGEKRAKYFFREVDERSTTGAEELLSVSHKTGVTPRPKHVTMFKAESNVGHKICRTDDLVINTMWAFMAALGVARQVGLVSPSYGVYRPRSRSAFHPDYVDRLLRTEEYKAEYLCRSTGIRASRLRLYPEQFLRIPILCPPPDEQAAIVRFLDHADRRIRRHIRAKRQLIGLLNEQKQAIIHRAVTRGLHPDANLKPSGIPWLGDIPKHWEVRKIKSLVSTFGGMTPSKSEADYWKGNIPWVSPKDIKVREIRDSQDHISASALRQTGITLIQPPAVLIVVRGMILARTFPTAITAVPVTINQDMKALVPGPSLSPEYFVSLLTGIKSDLLLLIEIAGHGTCCLRTDAWGNFTVPVPPLSEQNEIELYLNEQLSIQNTAIARTEREIAQMQEYRTRLTADLVTGKLDVRDAAAQLPDEGDEPKAELDELLRDEETDGDAELDAEPEEVEA